MNEILTFIGNYWFLVLCCFVCYFFGKASGKNEANSDNVLQYQSNQQAQMLDQYIRTLKGVKHE